MFVYRMDNSASTFVLDVFQQKVKQRLLVRSSCFTVILLLFLRQLYSSYVDPGVSEKRNFPSDQFLLFSCSFLEKIGQIIGWRPPPLGLAPQSENPESAH